MSQEITAFFPGLSKPVLIGLSTLGAVQLGLQIWAIVDLIRRHSVRFQAKWIWVVVIVGGSLLGPILYFAFARVPEEAAPETAAATRDGMDAGLSSLYRDRDRP